MVADLVVLKVHIVVPDLKIDSNQVDKRDVVTGMGFRDSFKHKSRSSEHVCVMGSTGHHELDS